LRLPEEADPYPEETPFVPRMDDERDRDRPRAVGSAESA
jgi:hypothetical protein